MFKKFISVSIPRSGHHLFINTLRNCFESKSFLYCEMYNASGCCNKLPCEYTNFDNNYRFVEFKDSLKLFSQKSHDLNFEVTYNQNLKYLVQIRNPIDASIAYFRWLISNSNFNFTESRNFIFNFLFYYITFFHKWCCNNENVYIIKYEDIISNKINGDIYLNFFKFIDIDVDSVVVNTSIAKSLKVNSHYVEVEKENFSNYDVNYYFSIFGIDLNWYKKLIYVLLPNFNLFYDISSEIINHPLDDFYVNIDFSLKSSFTFDLTNVTRHIDSESIKNKNKNNIGIFAPFGLSNSESGSGAWSNSDVLFFLIKFSQGVNNIFGSIVATIRGDISNISAWEIYLVVNSKKIDVDCKIVKIEQNLNINFNFKVPVSDQITFGGFFFNFKGLNYSEFSDNRKLGILVKKIEFTKND